MILDAEHIAAAAEVIATTEVTSRRSTRRRINPNEPKTRLMASPDGKLHGVCGYFMQRRRLYVYDARKIGVIVQKVTRNFIDVKEWDPATGTWKPTAMTDKEIDTYVISPDSHPYAQVHDYWEIWEVNADGKVSDGFDEFAMCAIIPPGRTDAARTTWGTYKISGEMTYYEAPDGVTAINVSALGFITDKNHPAAVLPHRDSDPGLEALGFKKAGNTLVYTVTVTWNSGSADTKDSSVEISGS